MTDPVTGALIGGGISALGSIFGGRSQASAQAAANVQSRAWQLEDQAKAYRQSDPRRQRRRLEKAGFNPLPYLQGSAGIGAQNTVRAQAPISNGVSQAGAAIAEAFSEDRIAKFATAELELENRRLDELVKAAKLKERVPGIYGHENRNRRGTNQEGDPDNVSADGINGNNSSDHPTALNDNEAGVVTLFGIPFKGSGFYSNGETIEAALGEGPLSWPLQAMTGIDMASATALRGYDKYIGKPFAKATARTFEQMRTTPIRKPQSRFRQ